MQQVDHAIRLPHVYVFTHSIRSLPLSTDTHLLVQVVFVVVLLYCCLYHNPM